MPLQKVTDSCWRLTGVNLIGDTEVTIGFSDKLVPSDFSIVAPDWQPYELDGVVSLEDMVVVMVVRTQDVGALAPISVSKSGTTHADFEIFIHNDAAGDGPTTGDLDIYVMKAN